jgi:hypothetical protein
MKNLMFLVIMLALFCSCDKVTVEKILAPLPVHQKDPKPLTPVPLGTIRAYFGDYYRTFSQQLETIQPVDSFSNAYFYSNCNDASGNIHLIRSDSMFIFAIYVSGYLLDSLPTALTVPEEYGKSYEIQFYPFQAWNWGDGGHYSMSNFYGKNFIITDRTDDILSGTFSGIMNSASGEILPVTDGEFKIKIFRKFMRCGKQ